MIAIQIQNVRKFMSRLLISDTFDRFLLSEASLTTFATFSIDGQLRPEYYDPEKSAELTASGRKQVLWSEVKSYCYSLIKGSRTPLSFKFVFQLPAEELELLIARSGMSISPEEVFGLFLNCQFHDDSLTLTTGSSLKVFTMDKSLDQAWDHMLEDFLAAQELS